MVACLPQPRRAALLASGNAQGETGRGSEDPLARKELPCSATRTTTTSSTSPLSTARSARCSSSTSWGTPTGGASGGRACCPRFESTARLARPRRARAGVPVVFANDAHLPGLDRELDAVGRATASGGTPEAQTSPLAGPASRATSRGGEAPLQRHSSRQGLRLAAGRAGRGRRSSACGMDTNICVQPHGGRRVLQQLRHRGPWWKTPRPPSWWATRRRGLAYMETCYAAKIIDTDEAARLIEALSASASNG